MRGYFNGNIRIPFPGSVHLPPTSPIVRRRSQPIAAKTAIAYATMRKKFKAAGAGSLP